MREFFKMVFATMVGFLLSYILLIVIVIGIAFSVVYSITSDTNETVEPHAVLELTLDYPIKERSGGNPFDRIDWQSLRANKQTGLKEILSALKNASKDDKVDGIFLNLSSIEAGLATVEEIRNSLIQFHKSGKFIYTYSENLTQGAYYLASVSDKIYLNPQGMLDFKGLRTELMFFKKAFEKLEIEPQVIRHGKYKGFVEPFVNEKMSPENREQTEVLLNTIWSHLKSEIGKFRKVSPEKLQQLCDSFLIRTADDALANNLVDSLVYFDSMLSMIKEKTGVKTQKKINFVSLSHYSKSLGFPEEHSWKKPKIAVIYASGEINGGDGDEESIGSDGMSRTIRKAREDTTIKAIVLRVNSPGGSALASEVIWREVLLAKKIKPVVISMGDVAASGGYYISCAADKIVAEPTTITGSIGVFGIFFNGQKLLNNKLGITMDTVKTGRFADIGSTTRPMTEDEKVIVQGWIERVYDVFLTRVSDGRKLSKDIVDQIGQGRVWSGVDAQKIGLVDEIGGVESALKIAAKLAKIKDYQRIALPDQKEPFEELLMNLSEDAQTSILKNRMGKEEYRIYDELKNLSRYQGLQARMAYVPHLY